MAAKAQVGGARQREIYEQFVRAGWEGAFTIERPPLFSPAVAAQDRANTRGAYSTFAQMFLPMEYAGWMRETVSYVRTCYLGDWTPLNKVHVEGAQALEALGFLGMNDLGSFELGQVKHHVQLDEQGLVASEGILVRLGEQRFQYTAGSCDWLVFKLGEGDWDLEVTDVSPDIFIFGVQGPHSLQVLERATGEGLRDIAFNRSRELELGGRGVRVLRTGISGELGYELHGSAEDANEIWSAVVEAGADLGLEQLGIRSKPVQHIEAGIATNGLDYFPSASITPGAPRQFRRDGGIGGSFVPVGGFPDYFRKPAELGWGGRSGVSAHEFLGRDAVVAAAADESTRRLVGLTWNAGDVVEVLASMFADGEPAEQMEYPRGRGPSFDQVLADGEPAGVSSGRTASLNLRATISLCCIDPAHAEPGTAVTVIWGRPDTPQREIRAVVTELPFRPDNRRVDVSKL